MKTIDETPNSSITVRERERVILNALLWRGAAPNLFIRCSARG
jgi:hypothetical protein